jgi:hypothetical protein
MKGDVGGLDPENLSIGTLMETTDPATETKATPGELANSANFSNTVRIAPVTAIGMEVP